MIDAIRKHTGARIWYHTCGDCSALIPDLIEMGVDILNPVQIGRKGMDPRTLKDRYGKDLVFWGGGIDSQHVHNIQAGVPPENVVALYDTAPEFGFYE